VVGDRAAGLLRRVPRAVGDAFLLLRDALAAPRLEQEEMAELVDRLAAEAKVPVDDANGAVPHQVLEPGLLGHFAARGVGGGLAAFEVALGESPVAIGVADQEEPRLAARSAPEHHSARTRLPLRATLLALHGERGMRNAERGTDAPTFALMFRVPTSDFRVGLEDTEGEVLPRVRLDVRQELPQLDHREGSLAIQGRV